MISTILSSRGQVILPSAVRKKANIKKGTKFLVETEKNKIILTPLDEMFFENLAGSISVKKGALLKSLREEKKREGKL